METRMIQSLAEVPSAAWDALVGDLPFLTHAFLLALEETACASPETGWRPRHLTLWHRGELKGAMPLYLKDHSYGEFIFDWAWAEAHQRYGLPYYPKLVSGVPFTPVSGTRLLTQEDTVRRHLLHEAIAYARKIGVSSLHILFPPATQAALMVEAGMMLRHGVQFHWQNDGYRDFEAYLSALTRDKRKKIRQERRRVADAGVSLRRLTGGAIEPAHWAFFHRCYGLTYTLRGRQPYLNLAFFRRIGQAMAGNILLVLAEKDGVPVAAALSLFDSERLYGRYWGMVEAIPCLHFEACYYQAIEFAIEREIAVFEGGAQGEHKIARGLLPVETLSAHWLADADFTLAVRRFLAQEARAMSHYGDELDEHQPFKR
jgi:predicted N-acyltransferase